MLLQDRPAEVWDGIASTKSRNEPIASQPVRDYKGLFRVVETSQANRFLIEPEMQTNITEQGLDLTDRTPTPAEMRSALMATRLPKYDNDNWFQRANIELYSFTKFEPGWDGCDAAVPNNSSITQAREFLREMAHLGLKPYRVVASMDGGVGVAIVSNNGSLVVEFKNFGSPVYIRRSNGGREVGNLPGDPLQRKDLMLKWKSELE